MGEIQFWGNAILFDSEQIAMDPACCCTEKVNTCIGAWQPNWGANGLWDGCQESIMTHELLLMFWGGTPMTGNTCEPTTCQFVNGSRYLQRVSNVSLGPSNFDFCTWKESYHDTCIGFDGRSYGRRVDWEALILYGSVTGPPEWPGLHIQVDYRTWHTGGNEAHLEPYLPGIHVRWYGEFTNEGDEIFCPSFIQALPIPFQKVVSGWFDFPQACEFPIPAGPVELSAVS